jgi:hypothetical protein
MASAVPANGPGLLINIRYFFLANQVAKGNVEIQYLPTDAMWGDYIMTKPLQGKLFQKFRRAITGMEQ